MQRECRSPCLGAHLSVAGGLVRAVEAAARLRCGCLQIFVKNQRRWLGRTIGPAEARQFRQAVERAGLQYVLAHAAYLINLAAADTALWKRSVASLLDEMQRSEVLGLTALVVHPGAYGRATRGVGVQAVVRALREVERECRGFGTRLLLESTAGQGSSLGARLQELGRILADVGEPGRFGVCLDTCHLFAAGYDFRTPGGYEALLAQVESAIGVALVGGIHLNDSKGELGGRVDRHEHIGRGRIGAAGFRHWLGDPRWAQVPMIIETPKGVNERGVEWDAVNLRRLRRLAAGTRRPVARVCTGRPAGRAEDADCSTEDRP